jgi:hypothetical protein
MKPEHLLIDWTDVLEMMIDDITRIADVHKFSRDLCSVASIASANENQIYSIEIFGENCSVTANATDTEKTICNKLIDLINGNENLKPLVTAEGSPDHLEKSLRAHTWFGAKTSNQLEIRSINPFAHHVANSSVGGITLFQKALEPIRLGGRSRILQQVANKTRVYKNSIDLQWMQANLGAHFAAQNLVAAAGQGTVASKNYDGESMAWTMPTNNPQPHQEMLMTIYGKRFQQATKGKKVKIFMRKRR